MYTMPSFFFVIPIKAARGLAQSSETEKRKDEKNTTHTNLTIINIYIISIGGRSQRYTPRWLMEIEMPRWVPLYIYNMYIGTSAHGRTRTRVNDDDNNNNNITTSNTRNDDCVDTNTHTHTHLFYTTKRR